MQRKKGNSISRINTLYSTSMKIFQWDHPYLIASPKTHSLWTCSSSSLHPTTTHDAWCIGRKRDKWARWWQERNLFSINNTCRGVGHLASSLEGASPVQVYGPWNGTKKLCPLFKSSIECILCAYCALQDWVEPMSFKCCKRSIRICSPNNQKQREECVTMLSGGFSKGC